MVELTTEVVTIEVLLTSEGAELDSQSAPPMSPGDHNITHNTQ